MEDVLKVYHRPYNAAYPVVCVDETSKQLIGEVREPWPTAAGQVERYDSVYTRHGVANLFLAFEPLSGWRQVLATDSRRRCDWARFVRGLVDGRYADTEKIVLVMDQLNTHSVSSLYEAFAPAEAERIAARVEIHHTPKHGSWLNMAEIELSVLGRDLPDRVGDRQTLDRHLSAWQRRRNEGKNKANWQFTTADARVKLRKLYPTINE